MVKLAGEWYIDHETEGKIYQYLRDRLKELQVEQEVLSSPRRQTAEETRVIDLIVAMELCHIGQNGSGAP